MNKDCDTRNLEAGLYFVGLATMAASLTLSPFMMSIAQFYLLAVWLCDGMITRLVALRGASFGEKFKAAFRLIGGNIRTKSAQFWHNRLAVLMVSLFLLHIIGLIYTSDFQYAFKDIRVKLPLLVFPIIMSSMKPLDRKHVDLLLVIYALSVFVATWFSFAAYLKHDYEDIREISQFISHIRFCLQIAFCVFILGYYIFKRKMPLWQTISCVALVLWFCIQLYLYESLSGYVVLFAETIITLLYLLFKLKTHITWRLTAVVLAVAIPVVLGFFLFRDIKPLMKTESVDIATLDQKTKSGNAYMHDTIHLPVEDGRYVGLYYCPKELREAWGERSALGFGERTANGENLEATLARYLTSKGLRKDREGVMALTDEDIRNVEQGVANYENLMHPGLRERVSVTLFEYNRYRRNDDPNGGSLSQRIEYTRASLHLIRQHPVFGIGTGDVPQAYKQAYDEMHSPLKEQFRFRAHNQYLSITVAFGIVGLALLLLVLFYPYCSSRRYRTYLYTVFITIILLSMLPEDTLETQAGASFYAFFNAFFLFASQHDRDRGVNNTEINKD